MWEKIRRIGVELYAYLTAPFVVRNYLGMLALAGSILVLTFWWLTCYTNHGESVQVPSYVGMGIQEAARKARSRNFNVAISDSIYMPGKAPGEIIMQDPKAQSRVKEGRTVYFIITKNNPDIIRLPELAGSDDYELYSRKLSRLGLKPRIVSRVADPKLEPNTIVQVIYRNDTITRKIRRGFSVEMGGTIDFVVSEAVTLTVGIPDCVGQAIDAAKFLIQASDLSVGAIIPDGTVVDIETAFVYRQSPKYDPNGTMRKGEMIDLYITQDKPVINNQ
ncbi:MAG: PASTA domain-containing protein [Lewinellaceae bacterium]|jgi:beta-lactam-binding protein with PASTA domain|nr:PASTA domain-containing protein [Lewinellaceae bacterium]